MSEPSTSLVDEDAINGEGFAERLAAAIGGDKQAVVARRARLSTSVLGKYLTGAEPGLFKAARLAKATGVNLPWLATGAGNPNAAETGFVGVAIVDVRLAAGAATFDQGAKEIGEMPFDHQLLRGLGRTGGDGLVVLEAFGDSMEPQIADGARVLLDLNDKRPRDGIFGFRYGDELRIKRLRRFLDGIEIISENPRYQPEMLTGVQLESFEIIGRAIWSAAPL